MIFFQKNSCLIVLKNISYFCDNVCCALSKCWRTSQHVRSSYTHCALPPELFVESPSLYKQTLVFRAGSNKFGYVSIVSWIGGLLFEQNIVSFSTTSKQVRAVYCFLWCDRTKIEWILTKICHLKFN